MTENRASCATDCLERVWDLLRELHPEIPPAIMLIYAQHTRKPRQNGGVMLGHFSGTVWRAPGPKKRHEVGLSPSFFTSRMRSSRPCFTKRLMPHFTRATHFASYTAPGAVRMIPTTIARYFETCARSGVWNASF